MPHVAAFRGEIRALFASVGLDSALVGYDPMRDILKHFLGVPEDTLGDKYWTRSKDPVEEGRAVNPTREYTRD